MKIISLVPSITETLFDFGFTSKEIIGRTKFCIHPENGVKEISRIGGTKTINIDKINALKPDLIIANKEENEKLQIEELMKNHRVFLTNVSTLEENDIFLRELGKILNKEEISEKIIDEIHAVIHSTPTIPLPQKTAYLIWKNPYMTIGSDTFIHSVLEQLGFENIFKSHKRYPIISIDDLRDADWIFLSSEPFPFKEKHIDELQQHLPNSKIILADGEAFSWFGSHLKHCGKYFEQLKILINKNKSF